MNYFSVLKYTLFVLVGLVPFVAKAQQGNVWVFGKKAGLDFNYTPALPITTEIKGTGEGGASVCDTGGNLLFYTEGSIVWDRNHNVMPNGTNLTGFPYIGTYTPTTSTTQNAVIVPMPDSAGKYYVFSLTPQEFYSTQINIHYGKLFYSVVDMSMNGGLGDVPAGRKGILVDSNFSEKMTAVTGDRCNIWLIAFSMLPKGIKAFEITASGINTTAVYSPIGLYPPLWYSVGALVASPGRRKLAACALAGTYAASGGLELYDFDPVNGIASNNTSLDSGLAHYYYGAAFSPDNSKLYASLAYSALIGDVQQFDLSTVPITQTSLNTNAYGGQMKLAPDGKIYYITHETERWLGTIDFPNLAAPACGYNSYAIQLNGDGIHLGLPNVVPAFHSETASGVNAVIKLPCFSTNGYTSIAAGDTSGWDYVWNTGALSSVISTDTPGTYWVRYHTPPCIIHTDTFQVQDNGRLPLLQTATGCRNDSNAYAYVLPVPGDNNNYTYTWRNTLSQVLRGPLSSSSGDTLTGIAAGNYLLQITTTADCDTTLAFTIAPPDYQASFSLPDSIICIGDTVALLNTSSGFMNWRWLFGDGTIDTIPFPKHSYLAPGTYTISLIAGTNTPCYDTIYRTLVVDPTLAVSFITDHDSVCTGQNVLFSGVADSTIRYLQWSFGDDRGWTTNDASTQHAYSSAGVMPVQLLAHFRACPDTSSSRMLYVFPLPRVWLGPDSGLCLQGAPILLQNLANAPSGPYHNQWNTGDTTTSIRVVHPGTYSLTVSTAPIGCSAAENIVVHKDCYIDIPNAFTPNGDGINDYFFPRQWLSEKVSRFKMQLFDRWGQVVFETTSPVGRGWDGKFNNRMQPQGVYVYVIDVEIDAQQAHYQGNLTLIR